MADANAVQAAVKGLRNYLANAVSGLTALAEWPAANQKLTYPSVTILSGKVTFMNRAPELISQTTPDPTTHQVVATEVVGEYDFKIQLDLWARNSLERDVTLGKILDALNAQSGDNTGKNNPMGLSLQLSDYFNDWVRYDIDGHQITDDEAAAERQERRVKIDLLVNCRAIRLRTYYGMVNIESYIEASDEADELADDTTETEINVVT